MGLNGQKLISKDADSIIRNISIDVSSLAVGVYFIEVNTTEGL